MPRSSPRRYDRGSHNHLWQCGGRGGCGYSDNKGWWYYCGQCGSTTSQHLRLPAPGAAQELQGAWASRGAAGAQGNAFQVACAKENVAAHWRLENILAAGAAEATLKAISSIEGGISDTKFENLSLPGKVQAMANKQSKCAKILEDKKAKRDKAKKALDEAKKTVQEAEKSLDEADKEITCAIKDLDEAKSECIKLAEGIMDLQLTMQVDGAVQHSQSSS